MDVPVFITSEQTSSERRISPGWTIPELKGKLELITGIPPDCQSLLVYGSATSDAPVAVANLDTTTTIGAYNLVPYGRIHVEDSRPPGMALNVNDTSQVEKYVMPEEEYSARRDTVLQWKKQNKLGRFDPNEQQLKEDDTDEQGAEIIANRGIVVGPRCQVSGTRIGTVKYVGLVPEINNKIWVGVEFDEPLGKNNGSIKGVEYFQAKHNHGSFVKPELVEIGEFDEEDFDEF